MERKVKVLMVEPNESFRTVLAALLGNDGGFEVTGSTGYAFEAMELLNENRPDIVLTDMVMAGTDGLTLLERVKDFPEELRPKVIIISSFASEQVLMDAQNLGAAYYIQKPCEPAFIVSRIRMLAGSGRGAAVANGLAVSTTQAYSASIEHTVTEILREIGIPAHIKGYQYLREAILEAIEDMDILNKVTKGLYPSVAEKFNTTSSRVERSIRHAIKVAWDRGDLDILQKFSGYAVKDFKWMPTNSEFIAMVADELFINKKCAGM